MTTTLLSQETRNHFEWVGFVPGGTGQRRFLAVLSRKMNLNNGGRPQGLLGAGHISDRVQKVYPYFKDFMVFCSSTVDYVHHVAPRVE